MTVIYAILVFGLIIFVHELGHFTAAKLAGITVYQFNIGFGPALIKKKLGETLYAIRLLPVGGAVMLKDAGEDPPEDIDPAEWTSEGSFQEAPWLGRFAVIIAGVMDPQLARRYAADDDIMPAGRKEAGISGAVAADVGYHPRAVPEGRYHIVEA